MEIRGKVHLLGDNIHTDAIIPTRYLLTMDPKELGKHCLDGLEPGWTQKVNTGDIIVAGSNFGCGSSREHAPLAIKGVGIASVIAKSFARIFFRNAFNIGLPLLEIADDVIIGDGDELFLDVQKGAIKNLTQNNTTTCEPIPAFMLDMINEGGLVGYVKKKLNSI